MAQYENKKRQLEMRRRSSSSSLWNLPVVAENDRSSTAASSQRGAPEKKRTAGERTQAENEKHVEPLTATEDDERAEREKVERNKTSE